MLANVQSLRTCSSRHRPYGSTSKSLERQPGSSPRTQPFDIGRQARRLERSGFPVLYSTKSLCTQRGLGYCPWFLKSLSPSTLSAIRTLVLTEDLLATDPSNSIAYPNYANWSRADPFEYTMFQPFLRENLPNLEEVAFVAICPAYTRLLYST
jgi:hypothetical protein